MRASHLAFAFVLPIVAFAACGGTGLVPSDSGATGSGGGISSGGALASSGGIGPTTGGSASLGGLGGGGAGGEASGSGGTDTDGCHPRVHLLIQRSGAMFQAPSEEDSWWEAVADALDGSGELLEEFGGQLELSASVFTKVMDEATCPLGAEVSAPVGAGDLEDVLEDEAADYLVDAADFKVDGPVVDAVEEATALLAGEESAYILLVASGPPDSCDEIDAQCITEDVFNAVRAAQTGGVQTRLLFLASDAVDDRYPQGVANAGAGEGVEDLQLNCQRGFQYSSEPGDAAFAAPENTAAVEQALRDLLSDIASCN